MAISMKLHLLSVLALTALLSSPAECVTMYPYGSAAGDATAPANDDGSAGPIALTSTFRYFYDTRPNLYINTNGHITFAAASSLTYPSQLPILGNTAARIFPFWVDIDTRYKGSIYYRQTTTDTTLLSRAATDIAIFGSFTVRWVFVITWYDVTYYGAGATGPGNTFQVVLISDWSNSFVIFNYASLTWHNRAAAGYNYGDLINYYSIPGSYTPCVQNLSAGTNVGQAGRWIFQIASTNNCFSAVRGISGLSADGVKGKRKKRDAENEAVEQEIE